MANAVCEHFKEKRHGMSSNLKENVLSTAGYKFIPRYCTSISLIQHPTVEGEGVDNASIKLRNVSTAKTIAPLSSSYTNIASLSSQKCGLKVPSTQFNLKRDDESVCLATTKETEWLDHMRKNVEEQMEICHPPE